MWPFGIGLTSWNYMWRTTPMARSETPGNAKEDAPPALPPTALLTELQGVESGVGPLYHRIYRIAIRAGSCRADDLLSTVAADLNGATPVELVRFFKVKGRPGGLEVGDEYVVRMPGPWDGPVRVVARTTTSFRLATLDGHLEAGQIEFRSGVDRDQLVFSIESWARSADWLSNLLYARLRMAKEVQLHMWTSFLENVVKISGGQRSGRLQIETRRVDV
jgi:hypothetical protein